MRGPGIRPVSMACLKEKDGPPRSRMVVKPRLSVRSASAGDDAREALLERSEPGYRDLGPRCLLLARPGEDHLANGLGLTLVDTPEAADFLFVMSMDPDSQSVAGWKRCGTT